MDLIKMVESGQLKKDIPEFQVGDTVRVHVKIKEGNGKEYRCLKVPLLRGSTAVSTKHLPYEGFHTE